MNDQAKIIAEAYRRSAMLTVNKNKAVKKELERFKHALNSMEDYLSKMAQDIDEIHHCGYVATNPMEVTQTVREIVNPDGELGHDFQMVFRFELTGELFGKVTFCPIYGGSLRSLCSITVSEMTVVEWFLTKGIYTELTHALQVVLDSHNESIEQLKMDVDSFCSWVELVNTPGCEPEEVQC